MGIFSRIFGSSAPKSNHSIGTTSIPQSQPASRASDAYFATMVQIQESISNRDYEAAARFVNENLRYIPAWVAEIKREYGSFDIGLIPAFEQGGTILALLEDEKGLADMEELIGSVAELAPLSDRVKSHKSDLELFRVIIEAVSKHPGCLQKDLKVLTSEQDGRRIANLVSYLEKAKKVVRTKMGSTYSLTLVGSSDAPTQKPIRRVESHRKNGGTAELKEIKIESLEYIPLPRAPLQWEETQAGRKKTVIEKPSDSFEIADSNWTIVSVAKIPSEERPDPAFRKHYPTNNGLICIDDLGNANGLGDIEASAERYDRRGSQIAKSRLQHSVYRLGVHPYGSGLVVMSKDCVLHAYDDSFSLIFETSLVEEPEIVKIRKRFEIPDDKLKNHIRCVALSRDGSQYLVTAVDEAWCVDMLGNALWRAKLPLQEGWAREATQSGSIGTSADVNEAISFMGLLMPISPDDIKESYRDHAKQWHPDLHPGDARAEENMKMLNAAVELLTGLGASELSGQTGATFFRETGRIDFEQDGISLSFGLAMGEIHIADWIYAADFASDSNSVYLAGYSGRVIQVNENGEGLRVYDIGAVPKRIIDTGDFLYLLTDTRLYVLKEEKLFALIDTFDSGDLIMAQTGFGLLEKNRLRWFSESGQYLGSVISKDPIRRIYSNEKDTVVETRQQRAVIQGIPKWWDE